MKSKFLLFLTFIILPFIANAQGSKNTKHKAKHHTVKNLPTWAAPHNYKGDAHVYFPDYYTFYDANRGGYVFWQNNQWSFTPTVPPYMEKADFTKTRVQILKGLSLDLQPQMNYPRYMTLYPAVPGAGTDVPVPQPAP